jgi:hypothetical protein
MSLDKNKSKFTFFKERDGRLCRGMDGYAEGGVTKKRDGWLSRMRGVREEGWMLSRGTGGQEEGWVAKKMDGWRSRGMGT